MDNDLDALAHLISFICSAKDLEKGSIGIYAVVMNESRMSHQTYSESIEGVMVRYRFKNSYLFYLSTIDMDIRMQ